MSLSYYEKQIKLFNMFSNNYLLNERMFHNK